MSHLQSEAIKYDLAVRPASLATATATGAYFDMRHHRQAVVVFTSGAAAAAATVACQLREATDAAGTGAQDLAGAVATITANVKASKVTLTLATVLAADAVTINGLVFTAHATVTTPANREFSISGSDTADAAALASVINDATYGVPGVTATASGAVITLAATIPGTMTVTIAAPAATITPATVESVGYVEIDKGSLSAGYTHVAAKLTTSGTVVAGAALLRMSALFAVTQAVAASKVQ